MPQTLIQSDGLAPGCIIRSKLNTTTAASAVIAKVIQGSGISITSTGVDAGTGDVTISANVAGGSSANPSALVGPTKVNGTAATFMTSDSAPAINLAATYPWTGAHSFGAGLTGTTGAFSGALSGSNFSGSSSGTNTGDQTNISGNAATATTATNQSGGTISASSGTVTSLTTSTIIFNMGTDSTITSAPSTFGNIAIGGNPSSQWCGIQFTNSYSNQTLMISSASQSSRLSGIYDVGTSAWDWYWTNGVLTQGTVPAANIGAGTAAISISGNAATATSASACTGNAATATTATGANTLLINGGYRTFSYSGQSGQPTWLWGTNDGANFYVWNPANFSVASSAACTGNAATATSATTAAACTGNAATATSATTATTATNQSGGTVSATTGAFSGNVSISGDITAANGIQCAGAGITGFSQNGGAEMAWTTNAIFQGVNRSNGQYQPVQLNGNSILIGVGTTSIATAVTIAIGRTVQFNVYGAGTLSCSSTGVITASDGRFKTKTRAVINGIDTILKLTPTYFRWNADSPFATEYEELGFVAQEVAAVIPEASPEPEGEQFKNFHDRAILAFLVAAIQEQQTQINTLKAVASRA